jgi:hypothetical protein
MTYTNGIAPIVTVYGPGSLHHLAYASNAALGNVMGAVPTTSTGTTNFALGFSYTYTGYAFYWDGAGDAFWRLGNSTLREPVGTSWANATGAVGHRDTLGCECRGAGGEGGQGHGGGGPHS